MTHSISGATEQHNGIYFADLNTGFIVGGFNVMVIYKTVDGGTTWNELNTNLPSQRLNSVYFHNSNEGFVVGGDPFGGGAGRIYHTINGGLT